MVEAIEFEPRFLKQPDVLIPVPSAWRGLEMILADLIDRFKVGNSRALEFGVFHGYSLVALSNFFNLVCGVDTFSGDDFTGYKGDFYDVVKGNFEKFPMIKIARMGYEEWIKSCHSNWDLVHIDIQHTFEDTYACGKWAATHSGCILFHDTQSYPEVKRAAGQIAEEEGFDFYEYPKFFGLGILVRSSH